MSWTNFHSHTHYCDGKYAPEEHIKEAIKQGLFAYGYTSHGPVPFESDWNMPAHRLDDYLSDIITVKEKYGDQIQIYTSLEIDYIPGISGCSTPLNRKEQLDYTLCSVHYVDVFEDGTPWGIDTTQQLFDKGLDEIFNNDIQKASERFFAINRQMLEEDKPDILGHFDKMKMRKKDLFSEDDSWYQDEVMHTLETIKKSGVIVEINTRGLYKKHADHVYPSPWIMKKMKEMDIPITLNSDSHVPREITSLFYETAELLNHIGYQEMYILDEGKWIARKFTKEGLVL